MYALFSAIPFVGHLNPLIRQAQELQRRGRRVAIAAYRDHASHLASEGPGIPLVDLGELGALRARFRECEEAASLEPNYMLTMGRFLPPLKEIGPSLYDGVAASIARDRPDVMIVDIFTIASYCAATDAGVPFVLNNPDLLTAVPPLLLPSAPAVPYGGSGRSIHQVRWVDRAIERALRRSSRLGFALVFGRSVNAWRAERGLARVDLMDLLRGRPILVDGAFGVEYARALPPHVHMVGPMLPRDVPALATDLAAWLDAGPPVVYANLGTVVTAASGQFAKMADAFAGGDFRVLWVVRDEVRGRLPARLPANVRVAGWIDSPRAVLAHPNVRVFVTHCGINSVYESVVAGTPMVGIPILSDQRDMAVRVADAGVGLWMDKTRFTAAELREKIDRVRADESFRARIVPLQRACAEAGGIERAADVIEAQARVAFSV